MSRPGSKEPVGHRGLDVADVPGCGPTPPAAVDDDGENERKDASGPEMIGVEAHPDAARVAHHAERHAPVDGGLELEEHQQAKSGLVEGPDPPEHVGVSSAEVLGDEPGWHALERGEVEAAGEAVVRFGIARLPGSADGGGHGEGAQGVLHGPPQ